MKFNRRILFFLFVFFQVINLKIDGQVIRIQNSHVILEINSDLQTKINSGFSDKKLMDKFNSSEYLVTKYYTAKKFTYIKKEKNKVSTNSGKGETWSIFGKDNQYNIEKILQITSYDRFPDALFYRVRYVNHSKREIPVIKWVNHQLDILPDKDSTKFWSFIGSSNAVGSDWLLKVNPGFSKKNYMGMNATDCGGGIPVIDLWRKDAGIGIGLVETMPRLISLPLEYDKYSETANMSMEYEYPGSFLLNPGDTLTTFESFIDVHRGDCFASLQTYSGFMSTRGIKNAPSEPDAFEPVWCAWGYDRNFTFRQILNTLPKVRELGIKWVGLDDGFQQAEGDWHLNKRFIKGDAEIKSFVDTIHSLGMKTVLWWTPLAADPDSKIARSDSNILLIRKDGSPEFINWWNSFLMSPSYQHTIRTTKETIKLFLQDWGFDALKLDGTFLNACSPDYSKFHGLDYPEQSYERLPKFFEMLYNTVREIKPSAVIELCPCGACMNFYNMPYTNQFVASDPLNSWQVRMKGKVYKALMPATAYFGDHVELTDDKQDFASQIGIGGVPGTKFIWPATGVRDKDSNLLTPEKEVLFKKWLSIYHDKMLSKATYRGELYDIGYDFPETHCIQKADTLYYAFFNPKFSGTIELRGLKNKTKYKVYDYYNNKEYGVITREANRIKGSFNKFLLLELYPVETESKN